jgi:hypothetical protein
MPSSFKRRVRWLLLGVCLIAAIVFLVHVITPCEPRDDFERIREGWTYSEVVNVFGKEPGQYHATFIPPHLAKNFGEPGEGLQEKKFTTGTWYFTGGEALIIFDQSAKVYTKKWLGPPPKTFRDRLWDIWDGLLKLVDF